MTSDQAAVQVLANKFYQLSSRRHFARQGRSNPPDGFLYHYTTVAGLQGIIETNCLYASGAYFLNDSSELEYGRKILGAVLEQWEEDNPEVRDDLTAELVRDLRAKITNQSGLEELVRSVYVTSFCQRDNVLSQWRAYGQAGGYSLGFPVQVGSIRNLTCESPSFTPLLIKVEYQREKQTANCGEILKSVLSIVDTSELQRLARTAMIPQYHGPLTAYDFMLSIAEEMLVDEIVSFKNAAFEEEDEWRLIVRPRKYLLSGRDDRGKTKLKTYFRTQRGIPIPYVKLVPMNGKLPVARIRSGPSIDLVRARASVGLLLRENDFPEIKFNGSEIPALL